MTLLCHQGFIVGFVPSQLYFIHLIFKYLNLIRHEIEKVRKFRTFLRNLNNDYPLVVFNNNIGENQEIEECAICKENMISARKLPCNHCFH